MIGKRIIITGASSGIGKALAEALISEGAEVIGLSRSCPEVEGIHFIQTDLRDLSSIKSAISSLDSIDALINNAGMAYLSSVMHGDPSKWDEMWEVNVRAVAYASQLALPLFPEAGGQIINLSSMSGHRVPPSGGFYSPTKFAVKALSEALRLELRACGNPTRVSTVSPGFVDTPLLDIYFKGREEQLAQTKESVRMLSAKDIAAQLLHILKAPLTLEIGDISLRSNSQAV